jgi:molybdopterin converting factor small subunit
MAIEIMLPPVLQPLTGDRDKIIASGGTVGECFKNMIEKYPGMRNKLFSRNGNLLNGIIIFLNGENVFPEPLAKTVHDGDKIYVSFMVLGG